MLRARVRLVVLNYNGGSLVERCVEHLEALDWPEERLELVVVDNCSSDGSDVAIEEGHPRVRVVRSPENAGFPANNLALRDLDDVDYVGLVNNDAFVDRHMLEPLVAALEDDPTLGAACPRILLAPRFRRLVVSAPAWRAPGDGRELSVRLLGLRVDGRDVSGEAVYGEGCHGPETDGDRSFRWLSGNSVIHVPVPPSDGPSQVLVALATPRPGPVELAGGSSAVAAYVDETPTWVQVALDGPVYDILNNVGSVLVEEGYGGDRGFLEVDAGQYEEAADVFAWCGAGVLLRPAYLRHAGLFDERFFMYYEDTDLAWRGQALGWRYRYVPTAMMRHVHAATSVEGSPMFRFCVYRNRLLMLTKNAPPGLGLRALALLLSTIASGLLADAVRPVLRGRRPSVEPVRVPAKAMLSYLSMLPQMLRERRRLRSRQVVPDATILAWAVAR